MLFRQDIPKPYETATNYRPAPKSFHSSRVLGQRLVGGKLWCYQVVEVLHCRNCRKLPRWVRWADGHGHGRVCSCGNPYILDATAQDRRRKRQQEGLHLSPRPDDEKRRRRAAGRAEARRRAALAARD